jgi:hypothetical protein
MRQYRTIYKPANGLAKVSQISEIIYQQILGEHVAALFATRAAISSAPAVTICAVVLISQPLDSLCHTLFEYRWCRYTCARSHFVLDPLFRGVEKARLFPLRARASLPARGTHIAEFRAAPARHVVASLLQVNDLGAARACLPVLLVRQSLHLLYGQTFTTRLARMHGLLARHTDMGCTARTHNVVEVVGRGPEEYRACGSRTVQAVFGHGGELDSLFPERQSQANV